MSKVRKPFSSLQTCIIDLENTNLPIDYFTSVLPRAQYGDESAAIVASTGSVFGTTGTPVLTTKAKTDGTNVTGVDAMGPFPSQSVSLNGHALLNDTSPSHKLIINTDHTHNIDFNQTVSQSVKPSALRSATALQKYKEIQNSNDPDFSSQVLAHFGIKPKSDDRTSIFIGGDDKTLSINPQVNTNFLDGGQPDIKAIGLGDLSAGCKFTASTYGMIIGIYRAVPQLDYAHVGIDRNLFAYQYYLIPE